MQMRKMGKAIEENKQEVTIKRLVREYNLHWQVIVQRKIMRRTKRTYTLPLYTLATFFLIAEKQLSL